MKQTIHNEKELINFGKKLAQKLSGGDILCLYGELGAGKTTLTKGVALGFDIKNEILSPTFTLLNILPIKSEKIKNLVHIDTYRLNNEDELLDIGIEDYLGEKNTICVIEWPEKIIGLLKNRKIKKIWLTHYADGREVEVNF
jgi:tRNA threonylcarbamoyladenosine biosynthesis protein TsaE